MDCPICYNNKKKNDKFTILNCKCPTIYHNKCIEIWFSSSNSCPTCRKKWNKPTLSSRLSNTENNQNNRIRRRRNAITPDIARELTESLFMESIGINSSIHNYADLENYQVETEIHV